MTDFKKAWEEFKTKYPAESWHQAGEAGKEAIQLDSFIPAAGAGRAAVALGERVLGRAPQEAMGAAPVVQPSAAGPGINQAAVDTSQAGISMDEHLIANARARIQAQHGWDEHQVAAQKEHDQYYEAHDNKILAQMAEQRRMQAEHPYSEGAAGPSMNQGQIDKQIMDAYNARREATSQEIDPFARNQQVVQNRNYNPEQAAVDQARADIAARQANYTQKLGIYK